MGWRRITFLLYFFNYHLRILHLLVALRETIKIKERECEDTTSRMLSALVKGQLLPAGYVLFICWLCLFFVVC